ncbi:Zinc-type alcohol dehydrogenase-like protein C2E1P3.01 [Paramyrothecium foliicola]|nr:Zinc-type alcohol dehydrogenase-like protein C2E1P3.01 [Paramyrothecium foliicola]
MKALVLTPATAQVNLGDIAIPTPGPGEILIRVHAVALNPVDELYVSQPIAAQDQRVIGTDFAGIVVRASENLVDESDARVKPGARVAGFLQGACSVNDRPGAFAEYVTASYDLVWLVPEGLSLEAASTVSMCGLTAAQAVFSRLGLPTPFSGPHVQDKAQNIRPIYVLIYGASTSLGLYIAQLVHASALASGHDIRLIGTASVSKHELLRSPPYGYYKLIDYRDPAWADTVVETTGDQGIDYAFDTISEGSTVAKVHSTLRDNAKFAVFRGPVGGQYETKGLKVQPQYGAVWEGLGADIEYNGALIPANPDARKFATAFFNWLGSEETARKIRLIPNPVRQMPGGLSRIVPDGFTLLGSGLVTDRKRLGRTEEYMKPISAEKLVYRVDSE